MTDSSVLLEQEIKYWINKNANYKYFFERNIIARAIILCAEVTKSHLERKTLIADFIGGLTLLYIAIGNKSEKQLKEAAALLKPVSDLIINRTGSSEYRQHIIEAEITGESFLEIEGEVIPITSKAILLHIGRLKAFPLTSKDIAAISRDFKQYTIDQNPAAKKQPEKLDFDFEQYFPAEYRRTLPQALKEAFKGKIGKSIRLMIEVLKTKGLINVIEGDYLGLYRAIEAYFGVSIGSYIGIFQTYEYKPDKARCKKDFAVTLMIIENILKRL